MLIAAIFCIFPTLWELYDDRNGETVKGKRRDFYLVSIGSIGIAVVNLILFDIRVTCSLLLILGIRMLIFDYIINILLFTNGVSQSGKWFEYVGKTAKFDQRDFWLRIGRWGRFSVRVLAFALSLLYFILSPLKGIVPDWV